MSLREEALWHEIEQLKHQLDQLRSLEFWSLAYGSGSANPAQPAYGNNIPFYRTDLGWWIYYDGTRWLTCHEYSVNSAMQSSTTAPQLGQSLYPYMLRVDYAIFFTRVRASLFVSTTNNGSNYWTVDHVSATATFGSSVTIDSRSGAGDSPNAWVSFDRVPVTTQTPASYGTAWVSVTSTGSPGTLYFNDIVYYRLIVT